MTDRSAGARATAGSPDTRPHPVRIRTQNSKARGAGGLLGVIQDYRIPPHESLDQPPILFPRAMQFDEHVAAEQCIHHFWSEQAELAPLNVAEDQGALAAHQIHQLA